MPFSLEFITLPPLRYLRPHPLNVATLPRTQVIGLEKIPGISSNPLAERIVNMARGCTVAFGVSTSVSGPSNGVMDAADAFEQ